MTDAICPFCGGNYSEPSHVYRCDGRQGRVEGALPPVTREHYPEVAGAKERGLTSERAADAIDAETLRGKVKTALKRVGPRTADETAEYLGVDRLAIRPRFSELFALGEVTKTGLTRPNVSGHAAHVWALTDDQQQGSGVDS